MGSIFLGSVSNENSVVLDFFLWKQCDHIVEAYSSIGFVASLYVESNVILCVPHLVEERTLSVGIVLDAVSAVLSMCLINISEFKVEGAQYFGIRVHVL